LSTAPGRFPSRDEIRECYYSGGVQQHKRARRIRNSSDQTQLGQSREGQKSQRVKAQLQHQCYTV
jgi:hypothetical protein